MLTLWYYTREIPVIPWYGYTVCRGVPNTNTVPVPVVPVTGSPRVFPYSCRTLNLLTEVEFTVDFWVVFSVLAF